MARCLRDQGAIMTRKEAERLARQAATLQALGFTLEEAEQLRRISMTLQRWHELECGNDQGCISRDETTNKPYFLYSSQHGYVSDGHRRSYIPDRETGAKKRLAAILHAVNERRFVGDDASIHDGHCDDLTAYIQTDPRGAALYIIRPGDVRDGQDVESCYTNGICVY
jgi:hypothetical protein